MNALSTILSLCLLGAAPAPGSAPGEVKKPKADASEKAAAAPVASRCPTPYDVQALEAVGLHFRGPTVKDAQDVDGSLLCSLDSDEIEVLEVGKPKPKDTKTLAEAVERERLLGVPGSSITQQATADGWKLIVARKEAGKDIWEVEVRRTLGKHSWKCAGRATTPFGADDLERACLSLAPAGAKVPPTPKAPKGCVKRGAGAGPCGGLAKCSEKAGAAP